MNQNHVGPIPNRIAEPLVFHEEELTETTLPGKFVTVLSVADIFLVFLIIVTLAFIKDRKINYEVRTFICSYDSFSRQDVFPYAVCTLLL